MKTSGKTVSSSISKPLVFLTMVFVSQLSSSTLGRGAESAKREKLYSAFPSCFEETKDRSSYAPEEQPGLYEGLLLVRVTEPDSVQAVAELTAFLDRWKTGLGRCELDTEKVGVKIVDYADFIQMAHEIETSRYLRLTL
jgi:hypothetical protein